MIFSFLTAAWLWLHPVHLSVTEVNYSEKNKTFQITSRIFIDDLELSIRNDRKLPDLDLLSPGSGLTTDKLIEEYLLKRLRIKSDGKALVLNYLGHEIEDVAVICYVESAQVRKARTMEVTNEVIHETHADQSNLVHVTYLGPVKSARLTREEPDFIFSFNAKP